MEEDTVNDYEIDVINIGDILSFSSKIDDDDVDDDDVDDDDSLAERISLPSQETCISHSLNLLATNDANKGCDTDIAFKRIYHAALAKCTSLWNATRRSSKASDAVSHITDKAMLCPVPKRWNS